MISVRTGGRGRRSDRMLEKAKVLLIAWVPYLPFGGIK